ncbi:hypothetical protein [Flavobacterium sp.]|uniref:hypothetical protein n=1 Tax=Flavobacterium sp. TaxID=239 RepID=UPI0011FA510C|nr:hypothetical protein [Flavobacterium sp.]RZJ70721.1 MAG: hypothetical protein EOO49_12780 [Flavobacterium sp.]
MRSNYFNRYQSIRDDFESRENQFASGENRYFEHSDFRSDAQIDVGLPSDSFGKFANPGKNHICGNSPDYFTFSQKRDFPQFEASDEKQPPNQSDEFPKSQVFSNPESRDFLFSSQKSAYLNYGEVSVSKDVLGKAINLF